MEARFPIPATYTNGDMQNFKITIVIYKRIVFVITPLHWFLWPILNDSLHHPAGSLSKEVVVVDGVDEVGQRRAFYTSVTRRYQTHICWTWLLFTLSFVIWKPTEAANIYPKNYCAEDDPEFASKWNRLCESNYFS